MRREHILSVLYDLSLTIGGEVRLQALLTKVLQRLLFHTSFPAGVVLTPHRPTAPVDGAAHCTVYGTARWAAGGAQGVDGAPAGASATLAAVVGDHRLVHYVGKTLRLPARGLGGDCRMLDADTLAAYLPPGSRSYRHALLLPVAPEGAIVLLTPELPASDLPLTQFFQPVLRNLAKAIALCRDSEQLTERLTADRDQARSDLALALQRSERERVFLRQLTDALPALVWLKDTAGVYLACNPQFERYFGATEAQIVGKTDHDFVVPEVAEAFLANDRAALAANGPRVNEETLTFKVGGYRGLFETTKVPMRDAQGRVLGVLGIAHDITERRHAEEQLHLAASVFTHAREGIVITAADGRILQVNNTFSDITGYARDEVLGRNPRLLKSGVHSDESYAALWQSLIDNGQWSGELWNRRKNGELYPELMTISAVRDEAGRVRHYVGLFSDISTIKEHERKLEHIAHYDALTALPNRVLFADRLQQAMAQCHRRGHQLVVAFLDLDGFKDINDHYGHAVGDRFLAGLAVRMKAVLRDSDTLARLGGDEFAAVFMDLAGVNDSRGALARLAKAAAEPVKVDTLHLQCTASIGVTYFPQTESVDADQLLRQADQAMYQAKLAGKNRQHLFDPEHDRGLRGHHESIERIRLALQRHEFVLEFQPKVNLRSGAIVGAEALVRWHHPQRGLLPPVQFLPVIEDHPLAVELGEWVLDTALAQLARWRAAGLELAVSVNVGARHLQAPDFVDRLRQRLAGCAGDAASRLELEILETSALQDMQQVGQVLAACQQMGVRCALDDFGTGYSSLSYLKRLPAQALKIDQCFVRDMLDDPDDLAILEGVLGLARAFHREAVAEGVESVAQGVMLLQLGCELAQGFAIARPMASAELPAWAAQWRPDPRWLGTSPLRPDALPVLYAGVEHRAWVVALTDFVLGKRDAPPPLAGTGCRFGQWLAQLQPLAQALAVPFGELEVLHERVHAKGAELVALRAAGQARQAQARLPELHALRDALLARLDTLKATPSQSN